MSGTPSVHDNMAPQPDSDILSEWTREEHDLETQPDGTIRLFSHGVKFQDISKGRFYPLQLLQRIFTQPVLSSEINVLEGLTPEARDNIVKQILGSSGTGPETYIKVFAILKEIGRLSRLPEFIRQGVSDQELPLGINEAGDRLIYEKSKKPVPDEILDGDGSRYFWKEQYNMVLPHFGSQAEPYDFSWTSKFPCYEIVPTPSTGPDIRVGSYGNISKILIHPLCHDFSEEFDELQFQGKDKHMFFAFKEYKDINDPVGFRREIEMLRRFNRTRHSHIVKLLAAFTCKNHQYLIFPWATYDLGRYWEKVRPTPNSGDVDLVQWICDQASKLAEAVSHIHFLDESDKNDDKPEVPQEERLYGRHGDLKPENILWYESRTDFGKLVIADMGLSKTHRFMSRTYVPHQKANGTPRYKPPEVEYENGEMGRTFDIWALGCVFLEFLCWLHSGYAGLKQMGQGLMAPGIRQPGQESDEYFEWVYVEDAGYYSIRIKEAVTQCIGNLRNECSQFVYDFLNIIEDHMLVLERKNRISAQELATKMKHLADECKNRPSYCVQKEIHQPRDPSRQNFQKREFRHDLSTLGKDKVPRVRSGDLASSATLNALIRSTWAMCTIRKCRTGRTAH